MGRLDDALHEYLCHLGPGPRFEVSLDHRAPLGKSFSIQEGALYRLEEARTIMGIDVTAEFAADFRQRTRCGSDAGLSDCQAFPHRQPPALNEAREHRE
jgi:hypothetical protein